MDKDNIKRMTRKKQIQIMIKENERERERKKKREKERKKERKKTHQIKCIENGLWVEIARRR